MVGVRMTAVRKKVKNKGRTRVQKYNRSAMAVCVVVFAVILCVSVYTSYTANKKAYINGLEQQIEMVSGEIEKSIRSRGSNALFISQEENILSLLSTGEQEYGQKAETDIWKSVGQDQDFYGISLEDTKGNFYLSGQNMKLCNQLVKKQVDTKKLTDSRKDYQITICEDGNMPLIIISSQVKGKDGKTSGFLHLIYTYKMLALPNDMKDREGYLVRIPSWEMVYYNDKEGKIKVGSQIESRKKFIKTAEEVLKRNNHIFTYKSSDGENMLASVYMNEEFPFAFILSISANDMVETITPYTVAQGMISFGLLLILIAMLLIFSRRLTKPVSEMIDICGRMAEGDETAAFEPQGDKELDRLASAFNNYRAEIEQAAYIDPVLKIGNRAKAVVDMNLRISDFPDERFYVFLIDLKNFSRYNEIFSVEIGDRILMSVAQKLSKIFGRHLYRISGDIFLGLTPCQYTLGVAAEKIYNRICGSFVLPGIELDVNYYMGACSYPEHGKEAAKLLEKVQSAARYAKTSVPQKNVVIYSKRLTNEVREEEKIAAMLRNSLKDGTLEMWYQPIMDPFKGELHSAEMLLRLKNEQGTYFPPQRVVEVAERFSMMDEIGDYILKEACITLKMLEAVPNHIENLHINASVQQLAGKDYDKKILRYLDEQQVNPGKISMEVTESILIQNIDETAAVLSNLKDAGIKVALDDFGTGYSSILYLSSLALDTLKLDMKLVNQVNQGRQQMEFLKTVIQLAKIKHLVVVAEGVEDEKTLEKIKWCGADYIQGYYYSRPIPRTKFIDFVKLYEN